MVKYVHRDYLIRISYCMGKYTHRDYFVRISYGQIRGTSVSFGNDVPSALIWNSEAQGFKHLYT